MEKKRYQRFDTPVNVHFHSLRRRLADADAISGKAALDAIVDYGILTDDSPEYVKAVSYSQEKTKGQEKTIITITPCHKNETKGG